MRRYAFIACLCLAAPLGALAQAAPRVPPPKPPEAAPPRPPRPNTLNDLFERLAAARDETEGKGIANLIERRWGRSGSDTADLLMSRAGEAARAKDTALAIELLDRVLALEPRWAEAWYRRANVFFMMDDPVTALADLRQALTIEPRHYGAWSGLGNIYLSFDDKRGALDAYRRALRLYPQQETIRTRVERLAPQVDGQDL